LIAIGKSCVSQRVTWVTLCGGADTSQEHFNHSTHSQPARRFLAIGLLESDGRAGGGSETQPVAAIPFSELSKL
jgi:hypothetical protein